MMKRPRSFIISRTAIALAIVLFASFVLEAGGALFAQPAQAGVPTSRIMDPRAGDPDEPSGGAVYSLPGEFGVVEPPDQIGTPTPEAKTPRSSTVFRGWIQWLNLVARHHLFRSEGRR